ncbi:hypothetical protein D3C76_1223080 [compost metagenome]
MGLNSWIRDFSKKRDPKLCMIGECNDKSTIFFFTEISSASDPPGMHGSCQLTSFPGLHVARCAGVGAVQSFRLIHVFVREQTVRRSGTGHCESLYPRANPDEGPISARRDAKL